jgi:ABC-type sugar transport system ATPase subunit
MSGELVGEGISKVFDGGVRALDGVSFRASSGRVLTLLGPSGCGKTTLLRIVAGLETPTSGSLLLDGAPLAGVPAGKRDVGFVFQNYALYPHLTVAGNLSLALTVRKLPGAEIAKRVEETASLLGLAPLLARRPGQLSGGQQQRVALGRALARRPRLVLMDEPLSNLDAVLREEMRGELKALFRRLGATVLYVTHDQGEAMSLSDEVLVLKDGSVRQAGPPLELYARPADLFIAGFVGSPRMTLWKGTREGAHFSAPGVRLPLPANIEEPSLWAGFRPEDVTVDEEPLANGDGGLDGLVTLAEPTGERTLLTVRIGEETLRAFAAPRPWPERVRVRIAAERIHWFSGATEKRLGQATTG